MARARNIKPSFFINEQLADNCPLGRLLFIGMWTMADYKGEFEWKERTLKIQTLPWDDCSLKELAINLDKSGLIRFYSDGSRVLVNIPNFERHQNPHPNEKKKGSDVPAYTEAMRQVIDLPMLTINRDKSRQAPEGSSSDPADSCSLNPESPSLNPEEGEQDSPAPPAEKPKRKKFKKPTLDQLIAEFTGRVHDPTSEAEKFLNHYESNGWKVGKNPMKSWPHTVATWVTRSKEHAPNQRQIGKPTSRVDAAFDEYLAGVSGEGQPDDDCIDAEYSQIHEVAQPH